MSLLFNKDGRGGIGVVVRAMDPVLDPLLPFHLVKLIYSGRSVVIVPDNAIHGKLQAAPPHPPSRPQAAPHPLGKAANSFLIHECSCLTHIVLAES